MNNLKFTNYNYNLELFCSEKNLINIKEHHEQPKDNLNTKKKKKLLDERKTTIKRTNLVETIKSENFKVNNDFIKSLSFYEIFIDVKAKLNTDITLFNSGLGNESVFETSLNIHEIYGCPFLPASSIKGSFKSFVVSFFKDLNYEHNLIINYLFGTEENKGCLVFFDTLPYNNNYTIEDHQILNEYSNYYNSSNHNFNNNDKNIIISIPCVKNITFNFVISFDKKFKYIEKEKEIIEEIEQKKYKINKYLNLSDEITLENILSKLFFKFLEFGIGAKTSVGFGSFKNAES